MSSINTMSSVVSPPRAARCYHGGPRPPASREALESPRTRAAAWQCLPTEASSYQGVDATVDPKTWMHIQTSTLHCTPAVLAPKTSTNQSINKSDVLYQAVVINCVQKQLRSEIIAQRNRPGSALRTSRTRQFPGDGQEGSSVLRPSE